MMRLSVLFALTLAGYSLQLQAIEYSEQQLKTLFTTVSQRHALNASRQGIKPSSGKQTYSGPANVEINGIVSRSGGNSVVWVNGRNTMKNSMVDGVKVYSNSMTSSHKIPVMVNGRKVYIKPGESWTDDRAADKDDF